MRDPRAPGPLGNPHELTMAGSSIVAGRYRIENPPVGEGGMGVVYKAFDNITKRFVAVKTIKGAIDADSIEMFHKEWSVLARLCHPNIIDILDIGDFVENQGRQPYFVMPLLPGTTLDKLIKTSSRRLTPERTIEIICQACRGLQAAHDQGVVHRDIKPSNLFVMDDDTVKIIDFGVVHLADTETRTGVKGTLQYTAPEQLDLKPATARSDLWSLGVVSYEALTGRRPFDGKNAEEIADAIRFRMPVPVSDLNPALNIQISQTVQRALAKEPYHRMSSVREFSELLQRSIRNEHIELFDRSKILPRINRVRKALNDGDYPFAMEIMAELESEGNIDPEISLLRIQAEQAGRAKTIHQLLESARTRMEEDEYPLALQKVQNVLALEPSNVDALALKSAIEQQRGRSQTERWHQIARQHTNNKLFTKARQSIDEILKVDPAYGPAKELLAEIGRGEQQLAKLRQEKQELYDSALTSYRNREISTALNKLERVIELGKQAPGHPNTEAQYLAFYEQIRSERDDLRSSYNEGKKALEARDFARALQICRAVLSRRPREPLFQALKIEVEDLQRQENSAAVAELHGRIETETDLDRKCALLKEATSQFSEEQTFQHSYRIVKERRDLVNSIVGRARHYESQGQFPEALNQWDVLRSIYSQYPGLEFEIQRLIRKQQEALQDQAESGVMEEIDQTLGPGDTVRAAQFFVQAAAAGEGVGPRTPPLHSPGPNSGEAPAVAQPNARDVRSTPSIEDAVLVREDTDYQNRRKNPPGRKILLLAIVLLLISGGLFFGWLLRRKGGSIESPPVNVLSSSSSGIASVMPDKRPLPQAPPMASNGTQTEDAISFHFASSPSGAEVLVDGNQKLTCVTPCDLPLRYGRHTYTMSTPKYETAQGILEVPDDRDRFVLLSNNLETVHIYSVPEKMGISVDGQSQGETPLTLRLSAGEHKITSISDASYEGTINVTPGGMNIFTINGKPAGPENGAGQDSATPAHPHS